MKKLLSRTARGELCRTTVGFLLLALCAAVAPAWAQDVDKRIQALEDELMRLKSEQTQVKSEQIEMRKEASAAAAALPTFTYRPGSGLTIEAADKAWSINLGVEAHWRMVFNQGRDEVGRTNGEVMGRRFRLQHTYCVNNCFYEIALRLDLDGFGSNSALQRGAFFMHLEQISPWFPTLYGGMDIPTSSGSEYRTGGEGRPTMEYDLLSRNASNTGSSSQGIGLNWDDKDLGWIGIPGRIKRVNLAMAAVAEAGDGRSSSTDRKDFVAYINIEPFSKLDSKWLKGIGFDVASWFCNRDPRAPADGCGEMRIRDSGDGGRQTLFTSPPIGRGLVHFINAGAQWQVGPYTVTGNGAFWKANADDENLNNLVGTPGRKQAMSWRVHNQLWLWSPKGLFTGSDRTAGSILLGTSFERTAASCGYRACDATVGSAGEFSRNRILVREWDIFYFIAPRASIGVNFLWYDAANVPSASAKNLSCSGQISGPGGSHLGKAGGRCDWLDIMLNLRWSF